MSDRLMDFLLLAGATACALAMCVDARGARAHSWYPSECCSNQDCAPVAESEIIEDGAWYIYKGVPFAKRNTKQSPDDRFHICYIPPKGFGSQPFIRCMWRPHKGV